MADTSVMQGDFVGLKLIHSDENRDSKPRVFVVAEENVFNLLCKDLALDVYPVCFDYSTFVQAFLTKSISTNNAIVLVSDSLSQKVAPLEAVVALTRENILLIPWQIQEQELKTLNVAISSRRPTLNTLRRSLFNHIGLQEPPARFDGDINIEIPAIASVVEFHASELIENAMKAKADKETALNRMSSLQGKLKATKSIGALRQDESHEHSPAVAETPKVETPKSDMPDHSSIPRRQVVAQESVAPAPVVQAPDAPTPVAQAPIVQESIPSPVAQAPVSQEPIARVQEPVLREPVAQVAPIQQAPVNTSSAHEFFKPQIEDVRPEKTERIRRTTTDSASSIFENKNFASAPKPEESIKNDRAPSSAFAKDFFAQAAKPVVEETDEASSSEYSLPKTPSFADLKPKVQTKPADSASKFSSIYESKNATPEEPMFAFGGHDTNGNQSMWLMYESNDDLANAKGSLNMNDFPTITDDKKQLSLKEPMVICVYSPKGGVGKTSIAVNLAARLSYTTRAQVCIVDLDIGFGNVGTRLGLYNPTVRELLSENHLDSESLSRNLVYDRRSGLFALLAPLRPESGTNRRKFSPATYSKILSLLTQRFDIVILDCPVELRDPLVSGFALTSADKVVMVVNNEQATLLDARRALEAMCRSKESQRLPGLGIDPRTVGLIVNQKVDNVGREVNDVMEVISGSDPQHPSKQVDLLAVIDDDRELWVGNANMARTVATSGENIVDTQLDHIWKKLLPYQVLSDLEAATSTESTNSLDQILSNSERGQQVKRRSLFSKKKEKN